MVPKPRHKDEVSGEHLLWFDAGLHCSGAHKQNLVFNDFELDRLKVVHTCSFLFRFLGLSAQYKARAATEVLSLERKS